MAGWESFNNRLARQPFQHPTMVPNHFFLIAASFLFTFRSCRILRQKNKVEDTEKAQHLAGVKPPTMRRVLYH